MAKQLVLVGGGHAHMMTLGHIRNIMERGHRVTVIGPSEHHYYSGMGPGMLSEIYRPEEIRFATRHVVEKQGGRFILDTVVKIDAGNNRLTLESGQRVAYDVLSCNAGSYVSWHVVPEKRTDIYSAKPIERLLEARTRLKALAIEKPVTVAVVGGGAAAVEVAGNAWHLLKRYGTHGFSVKVFTRGAILERFPRRVRNAGRRALRERGIAVHEHSPIAKVAPGEVQLESGIRHSVDVTFLALGVKPSPIFTASDIPTGPDGGLLVNRYLQSPQFPRIFGGGDCIYHAPQPLEKVGVYAVRQNPVLLHNLLAALEGKPLMAFDPGGDYLLVFNMGGRKGILFKRGILLTGKAAFAIKDIIDRRFMRKFQALE